MDQVKHPIVVAMLFSGAFLTVPVLQAAPVNFRLAGQVGFADPGNVLGLNVGDLISASGVYDDSALVGGSGEISFGFGTGNSLTVQVGSFVFDALQDADYLAGYPRMQLSLAVPIGIDLLMPFTGAPGMQSQLESMSDNFTVRDDTSDSNSNVVTGSWDWTSFQLMPVPVPAAAWLFGTGLLAIGGLARRAAERLHD